MTPAEAFARFSVAYRVGLLVAVVKYPDRYFYTAEQVPAVVEKMLTAIKTAPMTVNYTGEGFRSACKALGIKHTRTAILAYLKGAE